MALEGAQRAAHAGPLLRRPLVLLGAATLLLAAAALLLDRPLPAALLLAGLAGGGVACGLEARRRHRALEAVRTLAEVVARSSGEVRAPRSADPTLAAVGDALNQVLDSAADDRRRLREVAARAFRAQETERLRIASELQDEVAQTLAGLLIRLRVARSSADADQREHVLEELRAGLASATDAVRRYARGLYPPALEDLGVASAIEAYAMALSEGGGPAIEVQTEDIRGILARDGELALYRVVQEALANAVRHAGASLVRVDVVRHGDGVRATVVDDGCGFDLREREAAHPCLGLLGLRERALYAGGSARVASAPGEGTRISVEIPGIVRQNGALPPIVAPLAASHRS